MAIVVRSARDHDGSGHDHLPLTEGLPLSLFHPYRTLPPAGLTLQHEEEACDPEERACKTPAHVYEARCAVCSGTGWARNVSNGRRGNLHTCVACHGLGYVRRTTARFCPDGAARMTIARGPSPPPPSNQPPLFEPRRKAAPKAQQAPPAPAPTPLAAQTLAQPGQQAPRAAPKQPQQPFAGKKAATPPPQLPPRGTTGPRLQAAS